MKEFECAPSFEDFATQLSASMKKDESAKEENNSDQMPIPDFMEEKRTLRKRNETPSKQNFKKFAKTKLFPSLDEISYTKGFAFD